MGWCFYSHLVLRCTNWHQNKPIFRCLCLWDSTFNRNLYFDVQTGTKTSLFLVVYVYEVVLFLASCTLMYKQALKKTISICLCSRDGAFNRNLYFDVQAGTKTNLSLVVYVYRVVLLLASCTLGYKRAPKQAYFQLFKFMGWCCYSHLVLRCTNRHQIKPIF